MANICGAEHLEVQDIKVYLKSPVINSGKFMLPEHSHPSCTFHPTQVTPLLPEQIPSAISVDLTPQDHSDGPEVYREDPIILMHWQRTIMEMLSQVEDSLDQYILIGLDLLIVSPQMEMTSSL